MTHQNLKAGDKVRVLCLKNRHTVYRVHRVGERVQVKTAFGHDIGFFAPEYIVKVEKE